MRRLLTFSVAIGALASSAVFSQSRSQSRPVVYEGARLIIGDGGVPIENGAFVVESGRISALGKKGAVTTPAGVERVDLTGKTVMPAMVNAHIHIGYDKLTSWGAQNYGPQNIVDHLKREAYYGDRGCLRRLREPAWQAC